MVQILDALLTNKAYGFPTRGAARRTAPVALACLHITWNKTTAADPDVLRGAMAERNYANRADSPGPSAHFYIARDGRAVRAIDPVKYAAWSNGDVKEPNTANAGIRKVLELRAAGFNANEAYVLEIENIGWRPDYPITVAQRQACAALIAGHAQRTGLPIGRSTVHGHWEINGIDRLGCPSTIANHESFLLDIIERARAIAAPAPAPDPTPFSQADLDAAVAAATAMIAGPLQARIAAIKSKVAADLDALLADIADD